MTASAAPIPAKGLGSSGYRTALRPWAATWKSQVPRGAARQCTSASHSPASDADCKKPDAQFGHQVALLAIVRHCTRKTRPWKLDSAGRLGVSGGRRGERGHSVIRAYVRLLTVAWGVWGGVRPGCG